MGAAVAIAALAAVTPSVVYGSMNRPAPAGGGWHVVTPMPVDEFGGSSLADSRYGYVFGGYSFSAGQNLATTYRYDWFGSDWSQLASMSDAHLMSSAVFYPPTNSIYVFGGAIRDPDTLPPPVDYCRTYDRFADTWGTCPSLPDVRGFMASGFDPVNGKIYLAGGYNTATIDSAQTTTWEFDPVAGTYTQKADMPHGLGGAGYGFIDGKLYVAGGRDAENAILDTLYIYDPATDTWSQGASLPQPENVPGSIVSAGADCIACKLYLFGYGSPFTGYGLLDRDATNPFHFGPEAAATTLAYDPRDDSWTVRSDLNVAKSFSAGFELALPMPREAGDGAEPTDFEYDIVSVGGRTSDTTSTDDSEMLRTRAGSGGPPPPPPPPPPAASASASAIELFRRGDHDQRQPAGDPLSVDLCRLRDDPADRRRQRAVQRPQPHLSGRHRHAARLTGRAERDLLLGCG